MSTTEINSLTSLDRRLLRWLDEDDARFERYITAHPEAGDRIDRLLALSDEAQQLLRAGLQQTLAVPNGLLDRLADAMSPGDSSAGSVALDLLGVGFETIRLWVEPS